MVRILLLLHLLSALANNFLGFGCKEGSGEGNILRGARLWNNVDDGLDLWEFKSGVTIEDTLSWGNGVNRYVNQSPVE